jgi:hypothetical protein
MEIHRNEFLIMSHEPDLGVVSLVWSESTAHMKDEDFREALERFAGYAEQYGAKGLMVNVARFRHSPSAEVGQWRDCTIIPRYNKAGVKKFAFVTGKEGPAPPPRPPKTGEEFATGFFGSEVQARGWLQTP